MGCFKTYWIAISDFLVQGLLENCLKQATKENNQFSVNRLKIKLSDFAS